MKHVQDLLNYAKKPHVHLLGFGRAMCGSVEEYVIREGVKVQRLYEVNKPATCKGCQKALEMVLRQELSKFNVWEMEFAADTILHIRKENGSANHH